MADRRPFEPERQAPLSELKAYDQWMVWKLGKVKPNGRREKPPRRATDGVVGSKTDPGNWSSFEEAVAAVERLGMDGVGFCPTAGDPFCLLDYDGAVENGKIVPAAQPYVDRLNNPYLEVSPSGTGLRAIVKARLDGTGVHVLDTPWYEDFEAYDRDAFLTITFQPLNGVLEPPERQPEVEALIKELGGRRSRHTVGGDWLTVARKNPLFVKLHDEGDTSDYKSASEAAGAYVNLLKMHLGTDFLAIDQAYQSSAMLEVEPKWMQRHWLLRTLRFAFTPDAESPRTDRPTELAAAAFHGVAGDYMSLAEPHTEASVPAMLVQFLALVGNAMGRRPAWKIGGDRHGTNLYIAVVGDTSVGRKGTSYRKANWPVVLADPSWDSRKRSGLSTGEGLLQLLQYEQMMEVETDEDTKFKGVSLGRRIMMYQPEFALVLRKMRKGDNILSSILRDLWDRGKGGNWTMSNPIQVDNAHLSMVTHITELELSQELLTLDMANGFANRFLWICSHRTKYDPFVFESDISEEQLDPIITRVKQAIDFARNHAPEDYKFDPQVRKAWPAIYERLERRPGTLLGAITSRATPNVLRLAVIYAVLDCSKVLTMEHINAALAIWDFSEQSAAYLFGSSIENPTADRIYRFLLEHPTGAARSTITKDVFSGNVKKDDLDAALSLLEDRGLIRKLDVARRGQGRRPEVWQATSFSGD